MPLPTACQRRSGRQLWVIDVDHRYMTAGEPPTETGRRFPPSQSDMDETTRRLQPSVVEKKMSGLVLTTIVKKIGSPKRGCKEVEQNDKRAEGKCQQPLAAQPCREEGAAERQEYSSPIEKEIGRPVMVEKATCARERTWASPPTRSQSVSLFSRRGSSAIT